MNPFQIKICGITTPGDAIEAMECGADAIGLNFYQKSPRFVADSVARSIVESIAQHNKSKQSSTSEVDAPNVKLFGVFVNMSVSQMIQTTVGLNLDGIQLHGDEEPSIVSEINQQLQKLDRDRELVRAVRANCVMSTKTGDNVETKDVEAEMAAWEDAGIDALLLDAAVPGEFGGTGKILDWNEVPRLSHKVPLILAGGLNPDNVEQAIAISQARAVDVASGVESIPGCKDRAKVSDFVASARRAFRR